jgi:hypothetical protein
MEPQQVRRRSSRSRRRRRRRTRGERTRTRRTIRTRKRGFLLHQSLNSFFLSPFPRSLFGFESSRALLETNRVERFYNGV